MSRLIANVLVAALVALSFLAITPANADFAISKPKAKAQQQPQARPAGQPAQPNRNRPRRPRASDESAGIAEPAVPVPLTGIDPEAMQEAITAAKYQTTLARDPSAHTAVVQATDGKTGWSVNFRDCVADNRCGSMEFYTLWRVANETNVCTVWGRDVTKDPTRGQGRPYCYTVPGLDRQLHLKLSTDQRPYTGMDKMLPAQVRERMDAMISVWAEYLPMLPQAWTIASSKCPRATDKCV